MPNNLTSAIKKNAGSKATRKELMQKSPIPWTVLLVITLGVGALLVWPNASDWMSKQSEIKSMETEIPQLEANKQNLSLEKDVLELAFKDKAEPFIKLADQRFPTEIDGTKIAQIIEIYSVLMKVNYRSNTLELNSLSVGTTQNVDGENYAETSVSLNLLIDREMLKEVIQFLKTSRIPDELRNKVISSGGGETASIEFLNLSKLPVGRINSLSLNEERGRNQESTIDVYNAQLQVFFYSEPI